jgi:Protein of unknown function (DUF1648)
MRRILEIVSLAALALLLAETARAVYGSAPLTGPIPTHFDAAGNANAWGSVRMLWLLPAIAVTLYLLMSWVSRHPAAFNFPVRVTPSNRQRLEAIALGMIAWLKAELVSFFALIQHFVIRAARNPGRPFAPVPMPAFLAVVFLTIGLHFAAILGAGRARSS